MRARRMIILIAALALVAVLGACGGGEESPSTGTESGQGANQGTEAQGNKAATENTTTLEIEAPGEDSIAPGSRQACIDSAKQFPAGPAREAVLSECENIPR